MNKSNRNTGVRKWIGYLLFGLLLCACGCGRKQREPLELDVFAGRANYQGEQKGWYAKIVQDKFNLKLNIIAPNVSGGGNLLFESRLTAGKVGDIVITSYQNMKECVAAETLADLTPYLEKTTYLKQYLDVIKQMNVQNGYADAIYIIPTSMSSMPATEPVLYGDKPEFASYLPWSYYKELNYPVIENEEDLLNVLEQMQKNHPETADGKKVYAFSLFKDWDVEHMSLAANMVKSYGYIDTTDSIFTSADLNELQYLAQKDGIYYRMLHLYFEANRRGLLDPESGVQSFDVMYEKARNRQVLYLWWAWMLGNYDDGSHEERHVFIPVSDAPVVCDGFSTYGDGYAYAIGKETKDIKRVVEFLDWMASPEGMMYYGAGIEGVSYVYDENGKPKYTNYSNEAWMNNAELEETYGGGSYTEGFCQFNDTIVQQKDINPETGESFYSENWTTTIKNNYGVVSQQWAARFGAASPAEYLKKNHLLDVSVKTDYVAGEESEQLLIIREKCAALIKEYSWKMVFAEDEEQFTEYSDTLLSLLYQNGYEQVEAADLEIIKEMRNRRGEMMRTGQ